MLDNNSNQCSIEQSKTDTTPISFLDENLSRFSTSMDNENKENKNIDFTDFQLFLNSKKLAFQFAPIFGTIKNISILNATTIEEENPQYYETNLNMNLLDSIHLSNFSSFRVSESQSSFNLQSNRTDTLYNEDLLSSAFLSHLEE